MGKLARQLVGFGAVGIAAFAVDFGVLVALTELCGWDPVFSAAVSFCVSLAFNYLASMRFVFRRRNDLSRAREATVFFALSLVGLALNEFIMWVGTSVDFNYLLVKVGATAVVMGWNFWSRRRWLDAG